MSPRPSLLTFLCLLGLVGVFLNMMMVLSPPVQATAPWFPGFLSISTFLSAIFLGGLWYLKRWALWGYTVVFISNQLVYLALQKWNSSALILSLAITVTGWAYLKIMK